MLVGNQLIGFGGGGSLGPATVALTDNTVDNSNITVYTFSAQSLGTADPGRKIVVGVAVGVATGQQVSTLTVGGISAAPVVATDGGGGTHAELWQADVPTGTTGDVVVTISTGAGSCAIGVYRVVKATSTAFDTGTSVADPLTDTLNIPNGGIAIGVAGILSGTNTVTVVGITETYDDPVDTTDTSAGGSDAFATTQTGLTISFTPSGSPTDTAMAIASWGPG